ncbi:Hca operon transcriptional activator HcaR [Ascidiaceihabitans donghaensis]|uniref:Hca operon transcriptional activator HcaR n=1 Tax=Ascidiaceihabitans donghaensis TaxID=1510460 RepID=A0A2R8BCN6_9RHOB|nr:LysR family transcriptional regulator [Ascidiaceihabitans donghaensis]SPH20862.1 Hca operon transcriptional activator HcaR [Ascidiaceihabitans donghaensis]
MSLSLKAMTYFTTALRYGNIAKAAADLNIAASAVSSAIDQVEAAFDLTLVTRQRSRGIQATASGRTVAQKIERLLEDYRAVMVQGDDLKHAVQGTLRIGYYAPIAPAFLPEILTACLPEDGHVQLHLDECDNDSAQQGLLDGTYDAILFVCDAARPAIAYDPLITAPAYCVLPKGHVLAQQDTVTMAQIAQHPLVVLNRPMASGYYHGLLERQPTAPTIAAYANSTEMLRSLVGRGHGVAILNMQPRIGSTYGADEVVGRPIADALPPLTLAVGYEKDRPRRLVQVFVDACVAYFANPANADCTCVFAGEQE